MPTELEHLRERRLHLLESTSTMIFVPLRDRQELVRIEREIAILEAMERNDG